MRKLPGGHLIAPECLEQLLDVARKEGKPPVCPLTRQPLTTGVSSEQLIHFCDEPLAVLRMIKENVRRISWSELGKADAKATYAIGRTRTHEVMPIPSLSGVFSDTCSNPLTSQAGV